MTERIEINPPPESWSDEEVLAATDAMMSLEDDERLSELLDRQQAGLMTDAERAELAALMRVYSTGTLRKAFGLREAVRRGLREPFGAMRRTKVPPEEPI